MKNLDRILDRLPCKRCNRNWTLVRWKGLISNVFWWKFLLINFTEFGPRRSIFWFSTHMRVLAFNILWWKFLLNKSTIGNLDQKRGARERKLFYDDKAWFLVCYGRSNWKIRKSLPNAMLTFAYPPIRGLSRKSCI